MKKYIYLFTLIFLMISCDSSPKEVDVSEVETVVAVSRLDLELPNCNNVQDVKALLDKNKGLVNAFLDYGILPDENVMAEKFWLLAGDDKFKELFAEVNNEYKDISDVEPQLESLYKHIKFYFPRFKEPTLYMIMGGFGGFDANFMNDTTVVLGMENFLTKKGKYFPRRETTPYYLHRHFTRDKIASKISNMLGQYEFANFNTNDNALINDMIYWGKIYYFTEHMIPLAPDSVIIEYTPDEMNRVEMNKVETYAYFAKNEFFYNEEKAAERKFVAPRPVTNEIGDKAPGRIGRYLGWEIVRSYMKNNSKVTLEELMKDMDHKGIFRKAKYKPK